MPTPNEIRAAIHDRGMTMSKLAQVNGLPVSSVSMALVRPYPEPEKVIAQFLGLPLHALWPERWAQNGEWLGPFPSAMYEPQARLKSSSASELQAAE